METIKIKDIAELNGKKFIHELLKFECEIIVGKETGGRIEVCGNHSCSDKEIWNKYVLGNLKIGGINVELYQKPKLIGKQIQELLYVANILDMKYIAMDLCGNIYAFDSKPRKDNSNKMWISQKQNGDYSSFKLNLTYDFLSFEDTEPVEIKSLIY